MAVLGDWEYGLIDVALVELFLLEFLQFSFCAFHLGLVSGICAINAN